MHGNHSSPENIEEKISELNGKFLAFYWAIPIFLLIPAGLIYWLRPASHFYIYIVYGPYLLYTLVTYLLAKNRLTKDFKAGEAIRYEGMISNAQFVQKKSFLRNRKQVVVSIDLEHQTKSFVLWQNHRLPFIDQDKTLRYRLEELKGSFINILQLPKSSFIISYQLSNEEGQALKNWGMTSFSVLSTQIVMTNAKGKTHILTKEKVDYIHLKRDETAANFLLELSSDTEEEILDIPCFLPDFPELESWMQTLPGFDNELYRASKDKNPSTERNLVWERIYKVGVSKNSVYSGMLFYKSGKVLYTACNNGHKSQIAIEDIGMITVKSYADTHRYANYEISLLGFGISSFDVLSRAEHFDELLAFICTLPDFDQDQFQKALQHLSGEPQLIWQAKPKTDASMQNVLNKETKPLEQLQQGIEIENKNQSIFWGNFGTLENSGLVKREKKNQPNPDYHYFEYTIDRPVILQGLQLPYLKISSPAIRYDQKLNLEWPLEGAFSEVSFGLNGSENYQKLKDHLSKVLGEASIIDERDDSLSATWCEGRVSLNIQAWKPYKLDVFHHHCRVLINYQPDVSHFFEDDYVQNLTLNEELKVQVFDCTLEIIPDYKDNRFVRRTPTDLAILLDSDEQFIIWIDPEHNVIGIGNQQFSHIQSLDKHNGWLFVGHYWRDSPIDMSLYRNEVKNAKTAGPDNYIARFTYSEAWGALIEKIDPFVPLDSYFIEDRQYY